MSRQLKLTNSDLTAIVDDDQYDKLLKYNWSVLYKNKKPKAIRSTSHVPIYLHRLIIKNWDSSIKIDHRDRNIFNNQIINLRVCNGAENGQNRKLNTNNKSGYKGVTYDNWHRKWQSGIRVNGKLINLGRFKDKILAAVAYDDAALLHFGEFAKLNFQLYGA